MKSKSKFSALVLVCIILGVLSWNLGVELQPLKSPGNYYYTQFLSNDEILSGKSLDRPLLCSWYYYEGLKEDIKYYKNVRVNIQYDFNTIVLYFRNGAERNLYSEESSQEYKNYIAHLVAEEVFPGSNYAEESTLDVRDGRFYFCNLVIR